MDSKNGQLIGGISFKVVSILNWWIIMDEQIQNRHTRRRLRTIRKLKDAVMELMLEKGYDAVSIQEITDHADLGRGTFYIYFSSKEDIVWSILEEGFKQATEQAVEHFDKRLPETAEYQSYVNIFNHAHQERDLFRIMLGAQGSSMLTKRVQAYLVEDFMQDMRNYDVYRQEGLPDEVAAQIITGALFSLLVWWLEEPNEFSAEQMAGMLCAVLHK